MATLCASPVGEPADRAWRAVENALPRMREQVADSHRGKLWRPIGKLLRRARTARAERGVAGLQIGPLSAAGVIPSPQGGKEGAKVEDGGASAVAVAVAGDGGDGNEEAGIAAHWDSGTQETRENDDGGMLDFTMVDVPALWQDPGDLLQDLMDVAWADYSNGWDIWNEFVNE